MFKNKSPKGNTVQRIEPGKRIITDIELKVIAEELEVSADEFLIQKNAETMADAMNSDEEWEVKERKT